MILVILLVADLLGGCAIAPASFNPNEWVRLPAHEEGRAGRGGKATLQIIVTYGGMIASHTAVRLVTADDRVVFWDPAGDYGFPNLELDPRYGPHEEGAVRNWDLIESAPPDIPTYVRFRWGLQDFGVEVFEWELPADHGRTLEAVLRQGTQWLHPVGRFSTLTFPPFCAWAVADFLRRFGAPAINLTDRYFFPHHLAAALYGQAPQRLYVYERDQSEKIYMPSTATVGRWGLSGTSRAAHDGGAGTH